MDAKVVDLLQESICCVLYGKDVFFDSCIEVVIFFAWN